MIRPLQQVRSRLLQNLISHVINVMLLVAAIFHRDLPPPVCWAKVCYNPCRIIRVLKRGVCMRLARTCSRLSKPSRFRSIWVSCEVGCEVIRWDGRTCSPLAYQRGWPWTEHHTSTGMNTTSEKLHQPGRINPEECLRGNRMRCLETPQGR